MAVSKICVKRLLAECQLTINNTSKCRVNEAQCYIINHEPYEEKVAIN
jgi:hypothetical protein